MVGATNLPATSFHALSFLETNLLLTHPCDEPNPMTLPALIHQDTILGIVAAQVTNPFSFFKNNFRAVIDDFVVVLWCGGGFVGGGV